MGMREFRRRNSPIPPRGTRMTLIIAHRGASRHAPENTIGAFTLARELGSDAVELDVRTSADGVLVVHHDPHLPDGRALCETTRADLPATVPTLDEALDACGDLVVNVEVKNDPHEPDHDPTGRRAIDTARLLARRIAAGTPPAKFLVSSFDRATIDIVHREEPRVGTALLVVAVDDAATLCADLAADGHVALHPHHAVVTRSDIDSAHRAGLGVNVWTCDDPVRMTELIAWGIDGICTNVPDVGVAVRDGMRPVSNAE